METPEQQAEKVAKDNAELIARTVSIPLKPAQMNLINDINREKEQIQKDWAAVGKREQDLIAFALDFHDIAAKDTERVHLEDNKIIVIKKPTEKPIEKKLPEVGSYENGDMKKAVEDSKVAAIANGDITPGLKAYVKETMENLK